MNELALTGVFFTIIGGFILGIGEIYSSFQSDKIKDFKLKDKDKEEFLKNSSFVVKCGWCFIIVGLILFTIGYSNI